MLLSRWPRAGNSTMLTRPLPIQCPASMVGTICLSPLHQWKMGAHALALLKQLAEFAVARGCFSSLLNMRAPLAPPTPPFALDAALQRWQHRLSSTWLHTCHSPSPSSFCVSITLQGIFSAGLTVQYSYEYCSEMLCLILRMALWP